MALATSLPVSVSTAEVEVFRTNVERQVDADNIVCKLKLFFPLSHFNFDLEDCDHILRVRARREVINEVPQLLQRWGYYCEILQA